MSEPREAHWERVYAEKADEETSWFELTASGSLAMMEELAVGSDASVIDVGGGTAPFVDGLLRRGYRDVCVLDVSALALGRSQDRLGARAEQVDWIVADVTSWRPSRTYDVWHDRAVFHFLTDPDDRASYREALRSALTPDGFIVVATFAPSGPTTCSGLPVVRYDPEGLGAALGVELLTHREEPHTTPWGSIQPFTWVAGRLAS